VTSELLAAYPCTADVSPPAEAFDEQGHLNNVAYLELFATLRRQYMFNGGRLRREMLPVGLVVGVRELICRYESETMPGESLTGGCRVLGRSERSYLFDEILVAAPTVGSSGDSAEGRVVARARVLECVIDRERGVALPIPAEFWAFIERVEGRAMPAGPLPFPRTDWT
jgi:acyl-CoA thioesterase FadM